MAIYEKIIGFTLGFEGGYVNDPDDAGEETYRSVSRKYNPDWEGWAIVDKCKPLKDGTIIKDEVLEGMVKRYLQEHYWQAVQGDRINSQLVANMLFDWQVHSGDISTMAVQRIVKVKADGVIGDKTLAAINAMPEAALYAALKQERIAFYKALAVRKPKNAKYLNGWLRRVNAL